MNKIANIVCVSKKPELYYAQSKEVDAQMRGPDVDGLKISNTYYNDRLQTVLTMSLGDESMTVNSFHVHVDDVVDFTEGMTIANLAVCRDCEGEWIKDLISSTAEVTEVGFFKPDEDQGEVSV